MASKRRLLACFAHPDDESFGTGGALARYAAEGAEVTLVCATRGEVGEIAEGTGATPETLPQVREEELKCSCRAMGLPAPLFLGYRDSGMAGTADNENPAAFAQAPAEQVVGQLVAIIRRLKSQVLLTFGPDGGYGHPDHVAIHQHTLAALAAAADPDRYPQAGPPWQAQRVFYMAISRRFFQAILERMKALGMDTSIFQGMAERRDRLPEEPVGAEVDVSRYVDAKWAAIQCHATQLSPIGPWRALPEATLKQLVSQEYYALGYPRIELAKPLDDLFSGL